jgi:FAD:protein FMN transferase
MNRLVLICLWAVSVNCSGESTPAPNPSPNAQESSPRQLGLRSVPATEAALNAPWVFQRALMGTSFTILIDEPLSAATAKDAAEAAFAEISRIENLMSEWRPSSEVSKVNARAALSPVTVSQETFELIKRSIGLSRQSKGAFDITWAAYRGLWDFQGARGIPTEAERHARRAYVGWEKVRLDPVNRTVYLTTKGTQIGLGAIAKGYGIDRAAQLLRSRQVKRFLINGGGDLFAEGQKRDGTSWTVGVQHPRDREVLLARIPFDGVSIVSSGDYERYFEHAGRRYHHLLDLKSGLPARKSIAVTVQAANATLADALATAVFVMGPIAGLNLIQEIEGAEAAVLRPDGVIVTTKGLRGLFPSRWDQK